MPEEYPRQTTEPHLPILDSKDAIVKAILEHQVVIVCGATGSGKTTQLPQFCLAAGLAEKGMIACTQPRRIAAMTVAERVADELRENRNLVGWQHRFARHMPQGAKIKFMTDGVLLAELRNDPLLRRYQTILVDEAHERSLNIDFILGCLKKILPRRPELKAVISSATLETDSFSEYFGNAPVLDIPGRTFPVEVRYCPPANDDDDLSGTIVQVLEEILTTSGEGDILVFLPGERDIRACAQAIDAQGFANVLALPLLASLPSGEQRRAFICVPGKRRVILSTNVAETSVTIPGIRFVIDSGLARISRYSARAHIKRLQIEPISQASAEQRKGRCGRLGPGICYRLYSKEDFEKRDAATEPDIRRTSLAGTILSMLDWHLGDIETFPFLQPPAATAIREGYKELLAIGAIREEQDGRAAGARYRLTQLGRRIVKLPLDPALSRMLYEADAQGSLQDALIVVSALACEDPLVRPADKTTEAAAAHALFRDKTSDFLSIVKLWRYYHNPDAPMSRSAMRRDCTKHFVSYRKLCEWEDIHRQICEILRRERLSLDSTVGGTIGLHKALLSGLLANIGKLDPEERNYRGANGSRFWIFPGSTIAKAKKSPEWIVCAERVETSRLFARRVTGIDPDWIEPLARNLVRYAYHGESWDPVAGTARALRKAILYGLTIQDNVRCDISRINPTLARDIFIRDGLVGGAFPKPIPPLVQKNNDFIAARFNAVSKDRTSSPELLSDSFCAFFDEHLPQDCVNVPAFRNWLKTTSQKQQDALRLDLGESVAPVETNADDFPDAILLGGHRFALTYVHKPTAEDDGITCSLHPEEIPLLTLWDASRLVPGALRAKILFLLRSLPHGTLSRLAAKCNAASRGIDTERLATIVLEKLPPEGKLLPTLVRTLNAEFGLSLPLGQWDECDLPAAFQMRFRIESNRGKELFVSRSLDEILEFHKEYDRLAPGVLPARSSFRFPQAQNRVFSEIAYRPHPGDRIPVLPERIRIGRLGRMTLFAYPALVHEGQSPVYAPAVFARLFPTRKAALAHHAAGAAAFAIAACNLRPPQNASPVLAQVIERAAIEHVGMRCLPEKPIELSASVVSAMRELARNLRTLGEQIDEEAAELLSAIDEETNLLPESAADLAEQIGWLTPLRYLADTPSIHLAEYPRYFNAIRKRLERARLRPTDDKRLLQPVRESWNRYAERIVRPLDFPPSCPELMAQYRWLVEEFRVSVFAQILGTAEPVSRQRLDRLWLQATTTPAEKPANG